MKSQENFDKKQWAYFKNDFKQQYGEYPSVISTLFVVGLSIIETELNSLTKEEKQDVIHVGLCEILSQEGLYVKTHVDEDGWPHFKATQKTKTLDIEKQETYLRQRILNYFNYA